MQRIDTSTRSVDLFGTGKDGFKDGNVGLGIAATAFNAAWCNSVQEELANAIESAGLVLNGADNTQLLSALNAGWNLPKSIVTTGYLALPGGLIIQWGVGNTDASSELLITFPIAFSTGLFIAPAWASTINAFVQGVTNSITSRKWKVYNQAGSPAGAGIDLAWWAFGK